MRILRSSLLFAGIAGISATTPAQNDHDLDKTAAGTLGGSLAFAVANASPGSLLLVMPSFTAGPTQIAMIDPGDPRTLQIGQDLLASWFVLVTSPAGTASHSIALPLVPSLHAITLRWQTLTFPGATRLVDEIGNLIVTRTGLPGTGTLAAATLGSARAFAAALPNPLRNAGGGDVVIAGGGAGTLTGATGLATTEMWDFRTLGRLPGPNMNSARALHLGVTLPDGRTLVSGGADATGAVLSSCEVYDPATNTFSFTGSMATPRILHAAAVLADGRVMVAGGTSTLMPDVLAAIGGTQNSVEIWNPATGNWSPGPSLGGRRLGPALSLLPNGRMMVSGGVEVSFLFGLPVGAVSTTAVQIYNPATNAWSNGASMQSGRAGHHYNQVTLANGRVLMTGGVLVPSLLGATNAAPIAGAEFYDQPSNTWTSVPMGTARSLHSATLLADGRVAVCGGAQGTLTAPTSIDGVEVFDPGTNGWTVQPPLASPRSAHAAALQPDGLLVLFGGQAAAGTASSIETLHF